MAEGRHAPAWEEELALRRPRRNVLADDIYDILREGLLARRIEPGARLNLDRLGRDLQVSNTPIRQALSRLESEGLVTKEAYRGYRASPLLDSRAIDDLYEYRLMVEPAIAARAAQRRTPEGAERLVQMCDSTTVSELLTDPPDLSRLPAADHAFHLCVATEAANKVVLDNIRQTVARIGPYGGYGLPGANAAAWDEHRQIADAILAQDPHSAARAMRKHLVSGLQRIREVRKSERWSKR